LELRLPFDSTTERRVGQGNNSSSNHNGRLSFAWDFDMPEGTPVLAAADGIVVETIDGFSEGGPDEKLADRTNTIMIDHGGARFSVYEHLQRAGVVVRVGQRVERGQLIGRSGNTGFTTGPHLHFAVVDQLYRSLPVCFADVAGGIPIEGHSYLPAVVGNSSKDHKAPPAPAAPSFLPRDTFADNGILLTADLPAHVFTGGERIDGVALRPATRALAVLSPREQGIKRVITAEIGTDRRFSIVIPADVLVEVGARIDFTVVLLGPDGKWASEFSVPIYFRGR